MNKDQPSIETFDLDTAIDSACEEIKLTPNIAVRWMPAFERPLQPTVRDVPLIRAAPWVRTLGKLAIEVSTQGWRFPSPEDLTTAPPARQEKEKADAAQPKPKRRRDRYWKKSG